jgi:hypothetical protein
VTERLEDAVRSAEQICVDIDKLSSDVYRLAPTLLERLKKLSKGMKGHIAALESTFQTTQILSSRLSEVAAILNPQPSESPNPRPRKRSLRSGNNSEDEIAVHRRHETERMLESDQSDVDDKSYSLTDDPFDFTNKPKETQPRGIELNHPQPKDIQPKDVRPKGPNRGSHDSSKNSPNPKTIRFTAVNTTRPPRPSASSSCTGEVNSRVRPLQETATQAHRIPLRAGQPPPLMPTIREESIVRGDTRVRFQSPRISAQASEKGSRRQQQHESSLTRLPPGSTIIEGQEMRNIWVSSNDDVSHFRGPQALSRASNFEVPREPLHSRDMRPPSRNSGPPFHGAQEDTQPQHQSLVLTNAQAQSKFSGSAASLPSSKPLGLVPYSDDESSGSGDDSRDCLQDTRTQKVNALSSFSSAASADTIAYHPLSGLAATTTTDTAGPLRSDQTQPSHQPPLSQPLIRISSSTESHEIFHSLDTAPSQASRQTSSFVEAPMGSGNLHPGWAQQYSHSHQSSSSHPSSFHTAHYSSFPEAQTDAGPSEEEGNFHQGRASHRRPSSSSASRGYQSLAEGRIIDLGEEEDQLEEQEEEGEDDGGDGEDEDEEEDERDSYRDILESPSPPTQGTPRVAKRRVLTRSRVKLQEDAEGED